MVDLLALAHDRACEAALAEQLTTELDAGRMLLRTLFAPDSADLPVIVITAPPLSLYDELATITLGAAA